MKLCEYCNKPMTPKKYRNSNGYMVAESAGTFASRKFCSSPCAHRARSEKRGSRPMPQFADYTQKARDEFRRRFKRYPEEMRDSPVKLAVWCEILGEIRP